MLLSIALLAASAVNAASIPVSKQMSEVPEPSTYAMVGLALCGIGTVLNRTNKS